jgi:hypothetical protein
MKTYCTWYKSAKYTAYKDDDGLYTLVKDGIWAGRADWLGEMFESSVGWPEEVWTALEAQAAS